MNIAYTSSHTHRTEAENARDDFYIDNRIAYTKVQYDVQEDTVSFINNRWVVRILLVPKQKELELE